jgi:malto-oligosyltrehalose trehalohydrolase
VLENDDNAAHYLERDGDVIPRYDAQWNDDFHHAAHVLATGERDGYYVDYAQRPVAMLARALAEGFIYQGEYSTFRERPRGHPSAHLPPLAFVDCLQNHDQVGNRAFGERIGALASAPRLRTLYAMLLLAPSIPLLFMGEEWSAATPFQFFCDFSGELGQAVREGRRREFTHFAAFADERATESIPDPTDEATFERSCLNWNELAQAPHAEWLAFVSKLIAVRKHELVPRLDGIASGTIRMLDEFAFAIAWPLASGGKWYMAVNLGDHAVTSPDLPGQLVYVNAAGEDSAFGANTVRVTCDEH